MLLCSLPSSSNSDAVWASDLVVMVLRDLKKQQTNKQSNLADLVITNTS